MGDYFFTLCKSFLRLFDSLCRAKRSAAASSASVAALTSILSYGISQNFISIPPLGLFDAYLIENDRVGVGCVLEHEFTAAAAKRMTHLNIILRILTLRYIISYIWII